MKKNILITTVIILAAIALAVAILWKAGVIFKPKDLNTPKDNQNDVLDYANLKENEYKYLLKQDDGTIIDNETKDVLYDPNKKYQTNEYEEVPYIKSLTKEDGAIIAEYIKYFGIYEPNIKSSSVDFVINKFSDVEIAAIIARASRLYEPRTKAEVQLIAKRYFNLDNYELPTGTYYTKYCGNFTILESNGYYVWSGLKDRGEQIKASYIKNLEINDNKAILSMIEANDTFVSGYPGCYTPIDPKEECISGYYKYYLTRISDETLIVDKIEYSVNPSYIEPQS